MPEQYKHCSRCQADLPTTAFRASATVKSGLRRHCRSCEDGPAPESVVYALVDPRDQGIRYIGVTQHPDKRQYQHQRGHHPSTPTAGPQVRSWLSELAESGMAPEMVHLERIDGKRRMEKEGQWIYFGRSVGWDLLNAVGGVAVNE